MTQGHAAFYVRRQVVLANSLWVLLGLGIAACCAGSPVEAQQKDDAEEKALAAIKKWGGTVKGRPVTEVRLSATKVTDAGLEELAALKTLQQLYLTNTRVTDVGLKHLVPFKELKILGVSDTPVTDAGFRHLAHLKQLKELHANRTKLTDAGLQHLAGLEQLQVISLDGTGVTDAGLKDLGAFKQLRKLYLSATRVTDAGLKELAALKQLNTLMLKRTHVTDAGLKDLAALTQLRTLDLSGTQVTEAGRDELEKTLLRTQIRVNEPARAPGTLPPEPPKVEKATKELYHDFRTGDFPNKSLRFVGPAAGSKMKSEPEGLRITLSNQDDTVGVATQFNLQGDFEITVGYEILKVDRPGGMGAGLEVYLMTETSTKEALGFDRRIRGNGLDAYTFSRNTTNNKGKREFDISEPTKAEGKSGQMRITRIGPKAVLSIADEAGKAFRVLYRVYLGNEDVTFLRLGANPGGSSNIVDLRLRDLRVCSEERAEFVDTSPPPRGTALWLVAGLIAVLIIVSGVLIWWKRKIVRPR